MKSNFTQLFLFQILSPIQVKKGRKGKEKEGGKKKDKISLPFLLNYLVAEILHDGWPGTYHNK